MNSEQIIDIISKSITKWNADLKGSIPFSFYKELVAPTMHINPYFRQSWSSSIRIKMEPAIHTIIQSLIKDYFQEGERVLEVGTGNLEEGHSYLSRQFLSHHHFFWTYSDLPFLAAPYNYLQDDLLDEKEFPPSSYDWMIGCNVLDSIHYPDISKALRKMRSGLAPGKLFVHLADINYFTTTFIDACALSGKILFPKSKSIEMIYQIEREAYQQSLKDYRNLLSENEFQFFKNWGEQPSSIQALVMNDLYLKKIDVAPIAEIAMQLFKYKLEAIEIQRTFEKYLQDGAEQTGWEVVECGLRSGTILVNSTSTDVNCYERDPLHFTSRYDPFMPPGKAQLKAKMHVCVLRSVP